MIANHSSRNGGRVAGVRALSEINLNLLVALDALLSEAHVTRAAEKVGVTQSAMSRSLQKLREELGDELLVPSGRGFVRTPRAEHLRRSVRFGLESLRRSLSEGGPFVPEQAARTFTLAAHDIVGVLVLPRLMADLERRAPKLSVNVVPLEYADLVSQLDTGAIDVSLGVDFAAAPGLKQRTLLRDGWVCLSRPDHPGLREGVFSLEAFLEHRHVLCTPRGDGSGVVDKALQGLGCKRDIALRVRFFTAGAQVVRTSNLLLTMPRKSGEHLAALFGLAVSTPPISLPTFDFVALWHERNDDEPGHVWLREALFRVF